MAKRKRLTGEEARARILEAASTHLEAHGPGGLRLVALAKELGVSHQAILHHFGNKEGLVRAVVKQLIEQLHAELAGGLRVLDDHEHGTNALIDRAFEVLVDSGAGRLLAWLALEAGDHPELEKVRPLETLAKLTHSIRQRDIGESDYEDTVFTVMLCVYAVLGAAVFEDGAFAGAGLDDPDAPKKFRKWFASLLVQHLERQVG